MSQKLFNAVSELFQFIANNNTKLSLLKVDSDPRSWNLKTSTKEIFVDKRPNYNYLYFTEKLKWETQLIKLETNCHSTRDFWGCGLTKEYKVKFEIGYNMLTSKPKSLIYIEDWVSSIPKKSRNKLVRLIYWYENSQKNYWDMNNLMRRLFQRFKLSIVTNNNNGEREYFYGFTPTYDITGDRNRKINKLLRRKNANK